MFRFFQPKVFYVGVSVLSVVAVSGVMNYITSRKIMPQLRVSLKKFRIKVMFELFFSGIWNSFMQLSNVLLTGLDLLIANVLLGPSAGGILAVAKTVPMALQMLINVVPTAFFPHLTILYAKESRETFLNELIYTLKLSAIITGIPIAGFIVLSSRFFALWVPTIANTDLNILSVLTMISMVANFSVMSLIYSFTIANKLKWPALSVFIIGLLNVSLVLIIVKTTNLGLFALAGVSGLLEFFRCIVFVPLYAAACFKAKKTFFYPTISRSLAYMATLIISYTFISSLVKTNSWVMILFSAILMGFVGVVIGVLFMLNEKEKVKIANIVMRMFRFFRTQ